MYLEKNNFVVIPTLEINLKNFNVKKKKNELKKYTKPQKKLFIVNCSLFCFLVQLSLLTTVTTCCWTNIVLAQLNYRVKDCVVHIKERAGQEGKLLFHTFV